MEGTEDEVWAAALHRLGDNVDPAAATDDALLSAALQMERARRALDAASTRILGELDARGTTDFEVGMRTPRWLAHHAGTAGSTASARVKVGRALRGPLADVAPLLDRGEISFDHAKALADACNPRIADRFGPVALVFAQNCSGVVFEQWRAELNAAVRLLDDDGAHDPSEDLSRNRLTKADTIDELYVLKAQIVGADGLLVHQTIDAVADELFRAMCADEDRAAQDLRAPARRTVEALALVEICRRAMAVDLDGTRAPLTDVTLVVNAEQPVTAHTPQGVRLQDGTTRRLLCDSRLHPVVVDSLGAPLDMGRSARLARPAQRRAMALRDGGCVFPGCALPASWCDAHHLDRWEQGGRTDVARMASLCRHHHGVVHRSGWQLHSRSDGRFWFVTPSGVAFWGQQRGRQKDGPTPMACRARCFVASRTDSGDSTSLWAATNDRTSSGYVRAKSRSAQPIALRTKKSRCAACSTQYPKIRSGSASAFHPS